MYFTKNHEWVKIEGKTAKVGITDYAVEELGDIVFVELPHNGDVFEAGDAFAVVESVKAAEDIMIPISGEVIETNIRLDDQPESLSGDDWIIKISVSDKSELKELMDESDYLKFIEE